MLWNAKMRFGKIICALEVVRQMDFHKTIILTHRPVVNEGFLKKVAQKILMSCFINWKMPDTRLSVESIFL